jgi:hypothetical protein
MGAIGGLLDYIGNLMDVGGYLTGHRSLLFCGSGNLVYLHGDFVDPFQDLLQGLAGTA